MLYLYLLITLILLYIVLINPKGNMIIKSLVFGLLFGIIAYNFIPHKDYDLMRHHLFIIDFIKNDNFNYLITKIHLHQYELIPTIYSYLIAKLNNINLSQFFIVTLGYSTMYYLVSDYAKKMNLNKWYFIPILLFTIFGFYVLYFISGLYFYIAVILFSLAVYLDYQKDTNKIIVYLLYFLTLFIHDSLLFPMAILILYKLFKNRINVISIIIISFVIYFSYDILSFLVLNKLTFLEPIVRMYNAYMLNQDYMRRLYSNHIFFIEISKIITVLIFSLISSIKGIKNKVNYLLILLSLSTIFMITKSIVMIRFAMIIQLIGIVPMIDYFKSSNNKKYKIIFYLILVTLSIYYLIYFIYTIRGQTFNF